MCSFFRLWAVDLDCRTCSAPYFFERNRIRQLSRVECTLKLLQKLDSRIGQSFNWQNGRHLREKWLSNAKKEDFQTFLTITENGTMVDSNHKWLMTITRLGLVCVD